MFTANGIVRKKRSCLSVQTFGDITRLRAIEEAQMRILPRIVATGHALLLCYRTNARVPNKNDRLSCPAHPNAGDQSDPVDIATTNQSESESPSLCRNLPGGDLNTLRGWGTRHSLWLERATPTLRAVTCPGFHFIDENHAGLVCKHGKEKRVSIFCVTTTKWYSNHSVCFA